MQGNDAAFEARRCCFARYANLSGGAHGTLALDDELKPGADAWRYSSRRQAIAAAGALFAIWLLHAWPYGLPLSPWAPTGV
jgi:hypothetical protein